MVSVGQLQLYCGMHYQDDFAQSVPSAAGISHQDKFVRDHALRHATLATIFELMDVVRKPGPRRADNVLDYA